MLAKFVQESKHLYSIEGVDCGGISTDTRLVHPEKALKSISSVVDGMENALSDEQ